MVCIHKPKRLSVCSYLYYSLLLLRFYVPLLLYFSIISSKRDYAKSQYDHTNFMKICQNPQNVLEDKLKRLRKNMMENSSETTYPLGKTMKTNKT